MGKNEAPLFGLDQGVTAYEKVSAASILDALMSDLASVPDNLIHPAYNSDDLYIHRESTGEIVEVVGCSSIRYRGLKSHEEHIPMGYAVCTGFEAARAQLWHKATPGSRLICNDRATELRKAYIKAQREDMARAVGVVL